MKPKTQLCPCCGKTMYPDYEIYDGWYYTCLNNACPSKDIKALKEKESEVHQEKAKLYKERYEMVMRDTNIGRLLNEFKCVYSEEVHDGLLPLEIKEILSSELQNLAKM